MHELPRYKNTTLQPADELRSTKEKLERNKPGRAYTPFFND
jgi:hypothetical protein